MNTENFMGKMFGKIAPGMCRLSMNGGIAVKTDSGYKSYNVESGKLTNCSNFVFDIGEDFFFVIPTNKVSVGDIILVNGKPCAVIGIEKNAIKTFSYEDSSIREIVPEHHVFMGNTYFYGKIVSMFGNAFGKKGGMNNIFKYMMMSEMFKGKSGDMSSMMPMMMMMGGGMGDMFDGMFDEDTDVDLFNLTDEDDEDADNGEEDA